MNSKKGIIFTLLCWAITLGISGCGATTINTNDKKADIKEGNVALTDSFDQKATAIIIAKDEDNQIIQFADMITGEAYDLRYNGATKIYNKYGEAISLAQVSTGHLVDYIVNAKTETLKQMTNSAACDYYNNIENCSIKMGKMIIYGTEYDISPKVAIISNNTLISINDIESIDVISAWVYRNNVISINVERGHGYLTLENEDYFINGWIEVNNSIIKKITNDMRLVIPEGENNINISRKSTKINQSVYIERGQKMVWDLGDVEIIEPVKPVIETSKTDKMEDSTQDDSQEENEVVDKLEKAYENATFIENQSQESTENSSENDTTATNNE